MSRARKQRKRAARAQAPRRTSTPAPQPDPAAAPAAPARPRPATARTTSTPATAPPAPPRNEARQIRRADSPVGPPPHGTASAHRTVAPAPGAAGPAATIASPVRGDRPPAAVGTVPRGPRAVRPGEPEAPDAGARGTEPRPVERERPADGRRTREEPPDRRTPEEAFDELYRETAGALVRQAELLTGDAVLARHAVGGAFDLAWQRWPEVARDSDPVGWVRAAVYDLALAPWQRWIPAWAPHGVRSAPTAPHGADGQDVPGGSSGQDGTGAPRRPAGPGGPNAPSRQGPGGPRGPGGQDMPGGPSSPDAPRGEDRPGGRGRPGRQDEALAEALRALPPVRRRVLLLHDGLGLEVDAVATEVEAGDTATAARLAAGREDLARAVPEVPAEELPARLRALLDAAPPEQAGAPAAVRAASERGVRRRTLAAWGLTLLVAAATAVALLVAPDRGAPPGPGTAHPPGAPATAPAQHGGAGPSPSGERTRAASDR